MKRECVLSGDCKNWNVSALFSISLHCAWLHSYMSNAQKTWWSDIHHIVGVWTDVPRERLREAVTAMAADSNGWKRLEKDQGSTVSACPALNERGEEFYRAFIWEITSWETPIAENLSYSSRWKRPEKGPAWWPAMNSLWHLDNCPESESNGWKRLEKDLGSTISACPTLNESGEDFSVKSRIEAQKASDGGID